jgi:flagellar protein FliL
MSSAAATSPVVAPKRSKKKLIVVAGIVTVLLGAAGGGAYVYLQKAKPASETKDEAATTAAKDTKKDPAHKPVFVQFESFTVNLNDKDNDRFAQILFYVEVLDTAVGERVKLQMPAIRGRVLSLLSNKTSTDLKGREGKEQLATEILAETRLAMGLAAEEKSLIAVHFSQFVMQ